MGDGRSTITYDAAPGSPDPGSPAATVSYEDHGSPAASVSDEDDVCQAFQ